MTVSDKDTLIQRQWKDAGEDETQDVTPDSSTVWSVSTRTSRSITSISTAASAKKKNQEEGEFENEWTSDRENMTASLREFQLDMHEKLKIQHQNEHQDSYHELRASLEKFDSMIDDISGDDEEEEASVDTYQKVVDHYETSRNDLATSLKAFQINIESILTPKKEGTISSPIHVADFHNREMEIPPRSPIYVADFPNREMETPPVKKKHKKASRTAKVRRTPKTPEDDVNRRTKKNGSSSKSSNNAKNNRPSSRRRSIAEIDMTKVRRNVPSTPKRERASAAAVGTPKSAPTKYRIKSPQLLAQVTSAPPLSSPVSERSSFRKKSAKFQSHIPPPPAPPLVGQGEPYTETTTVMKSSEIRKELEDYGISTEQFLEKSELVMALAKARSEHHAKQKQKQKKASKKKASPSMTTSRKRSSSQRRRRQSLSERPSYHRSSSEARISLTNITSKEIKKKLQAYGVSTDSFIERSEMVEALKKVKRERRRGKQKQKNKKTITTNGEERVARRPSIIQVSSERNINSPSLKTAAAAAAVKYKSSSLVGRSRFVELQTVLYTSNSGAVGEATILKIHLDDELVPFYRVRLEASGKVKQTDDDHLAALPNTRPKSDDMQRPSTTSTMKGNLAAKRPECTRSQSCEYVTGISHKINSDSYAMAGCVADMVPNDNAKRPGYLRSQSCDYVPGPQNDPTSTNHEPSTCALNSDSRPGGDSSANARSEKKSRMTLRKFISGVSKDVLKRGPTHSRKEQALGEDCSIAV
jgi:hypothetical protein